MPSSNVPRRARERYVQKRKNEGRVYLWSREGGVCLCSFPMHRSSQPRGVKKGTAPISAANSMRYSGAHLQAAKVDSGGLMGHGGGNNKDRNLDGAQPAKYEQRRRSSSNGANDQMDLGKRASSWSVEQGAKRVRADVQEDAGKASLEVILDVGDGDGEVCACAFAFALLARCFLFFFDR